MADHINCNNRRTTVLDTAHAVITWFGGTTFTQDDLKAFLTSFAASGRPVSSEKNILPVIEAMGRLEVIRDESDSHKVGAYLSNDLFRIVDSPDDNDPADVYVQGYSEGFESGKNLGEQAVKLMQEKHEEMKRDVEHAILEVIEAVELEREEQQAKLDEMTKKYQEAAEVVVQMTKTAIGLA